MADIGGNVWHLYPNDVPLDPIGLVTDGGNLNAVNVPSDGGPVFIHRIVWRAGPSSANGDVANLKDGADRDVFFHILGANDPNRIEAELVDELPYRGLKLVVLDSGVLDLYIR